MPKHVITQATLERSVSRAIERADMTKLIRIQRESLEAFAHVLVHDLRAPLRSVKGAIEMLLEDLPPYSVAEYEELLTFVESGATGMHKLIKALQSYNSLGGERPTFASIDLAQVFAAVSQNLKAGIAAANADVQVDCALPTVPAIEPQVIQLFQNNVGNGIKYNRSALPRITVTADPEADGWSIRVAEIGIRIDPAKASTAFEPFKRVHKDEGFEGTGLGLATCKRIIDLHGGTIRYEVNFRAAAFLCVSSKVAGRIGGPEIVRAPNRRFSVEQTRVSMSSLSK